MIWKLAEKITLRGFYMDSGHDQSKYQLLSLGSEALDFGTRSIYGFGTLRVQMIDSYKGSKHC